MAQTSRIEWTEATWNPTVGCTKISLGCKHCYAEAMAKRLQAMGTPAGGTLYLVRVVVDSGPDGDTVVTVYRTSKIDKYWSSP